jgi:hypothetical protein
VEQLEDTDPRDSFVTPFPKARNMRELMMALNAHGMLSEADMPWLQHAAQLKQWREDRTRFEVKAAQPEITLRMDDDEEYADDETFVPSPENSAFSDDDSSSSASRSDNDDSSDGSASGRDSSESSDYSSDCSSTTSSEPPRDQRGRSGRRHMAPRVARSKKMRTK